MSCGSPARVHQHERRATPGDDGCQRGFVQQAADVVDHRGAGPERDVGDAAPCRYPLRSGSASRPRRASTTGSDAGNLLFGVHGLRSGPGRFAADVDEIRASRLRAPWRAATAREGSERWSASPKESGVTFSTPMTSGRPPSSRTRPPWQRNAVGRRDANDVVTSLQSTVTSQVHRPRPAVDW